LHADAAAGHRGKQGGATSWVLLLSLVKVHLWAAANYVCQAEAVDVRNFVGRAGCPCPCCGACTRGIRLNQRQRAGQPARAEGRQEAVWGFVRLDYTVFLE